MKRRELLTGLLGLGAIVPVAMADGIKQSALTSEIARLQLMTGQQISRTAAVTPPDLDITLPDAQTFPVEYKSLGVKDGRSRAQRDNALEDIRTYYGWWREESVRGSYALVLPLAQLPVNTYVRNPSYSPDYKPHPIDLNWLIEAIHNRRTYMVEELVRVLCDFAIVPGSQEVPYMTKSQSCRISRVNSPRCVIDLCELESENLARLIAMLSLDLMIGYQKHVIARETLGFQQLRDGGFTPIGTNLTHTPLKVECEIKNGLLECVAYFESVGIVYSQESSDVLKRI